MTAAGRNATMMLNASFWPAESDCCSSGEADFVRPRGLSQKPRVIWMNRR